MPSKYKCIVCLLSLSSNTYDPVQGAEIHLISVAWIPEGVAPLVIEYPRSTFAPLKTQHICQIALYISKMFNQAKAFNPFEF